MNQRQPLGAAPLVITLLCLAAWLGGCWYVSSKAMPEASIYESPVFATVAEARKHLSIPLPDEAKNIQFAGYREWIAAEDLMRFMAPVEVCLKHAAVISPGKQLTPLSAQELAISTRQTFGRNFKDSSWFDLSKATNVVHVGGGSHKAEIWIDQDRGVFYYLYTD